MKRLTVLLSVTLLLGCGEFSADQSFQSIASLQDVNNNVRQNVSKPACVVDYADYEINGKLMSFQITNKANVGVGFNLFDGFFKAIGLSFKTETGTMQMSMDLKQTLRPSEMVADITGEGKSSGSEFRFNLNALQLGVDFGYYYQTPISKLSERTLQDSLKRLTTELAAVETTWTTKVVNVPNRKEVIVPAGSVAGVRVGDMFKIYNVELLWRGAACASELLLERKTTSAPIAKGRVIQLEKNAALLEIYELSGDDVSIEAGARVEVEHLPLAKKEKSRGLNRSVRIVNIESGPLVITDGVKVDLSVYINEQVTALLNNYGLYERK